MAENVLFDPIFGIRLRHNKQEKVTLGQLLEAVDAGELVDLTGMKAHQRAGTVTTLAIMRSALRMHIPDISVSDALSASDYTAAWIDQVGEDAGRISSPRDEVAFLQAPLLADPHLSKGMDATDVQFSDVRHEIKGSGDTGDAQSWLYAMMSGMLRIYVKDNVSGSRWGNTFLLAGDGVSIGSEIRHLSDSYLALAADRETIEDTYPTIGTSAKNHLLFLTPLAPDAAALSTKDIPFPFLEAPRALRLMKARSPGVYVARQMTLKNPRVDVKSINENLLDPHVAISEGKPYRLIKSRRFDYRFVTNSLFSPDGSIVEQRPYAVTRPFHAVRVCALRTDQGKTTGYYETVVSYKEEKRSVGLGKKSAKDRVSLLSAYGLNATGNIQSKAVYAAGAMMVGGDSELAAASGSLATETFRSVMDEQLPLWVLNRASEPASDLEGDKETYAEIAVRAAYAAVMAADLSSPFVSPRIKAAAWSFFDYAMFKGKNLERYNLMKSAPKPQDDRPLIVIRTGGALSAISGKIHADPDITKTLRTMPLSDRPIAYWRLALEFPDGCDEVADVILRGLGSISHVTKENDASGGGWVPGFGSILAKASFPESRVDRLLMAHGHTLRALALESWQFSSAKGVVRADWRSLSALLISDCLGDEDGVRWSRARIAREFVRTPSS